MGIRRTKPNALRGVPFDETSIERQHKARCPATPSLRDHRRQVRNEDLHTELDYYSEEYDEEREMEPRPVRVREATLFLQTGCLRVRRHKGRVVEFKEALNKSRSRAERQFNGRRTSE
ncbi:hypothetical protein Tco_0939797 [Tanacetum coccineum]|uniref:Uncharacterized protein n=1 Tax=Tanacetum coccineum TaxID=301880 RepID=A0ABQ5DNH5_9ASTR